MQFPHITTIFPNITTNFAVYITNASISPSELYANIKRIQKQH